MANYIDFYCQDDTSFSTRFIGNDSKSNIQQMVRETIAEDLSFEPNGETIDVRLGEDIIGNFRIPDEPAFEDAAYNDETKELTFAYDQNGVSGEKKVDLSDLVDTYSGESGIDVNDKSISVKYDENTMEITENGELKAKSDNLWGEI